MKSETLTHAAVLWDYLSSFRSAATADAIVVCCSYDLRVCDHACSLIKEGMASTLVLSGNTGHWTRHIWEQPEAVIFADRAVNNGVLPSKIVIEDRSTNFGENISFSRALLPKARSVVFVTKPAAVLRVLLTVKAQWSSVEAHVSCPSLIFPDEVSNIVGVLGAIDEMVGDIERILEYPKRGYQIPHELPAHVLTSWQYLLESGFTGHLMSTPRESVDHGHDNQWERTQDQMRATSDA